jgi:hypothetical protein
MRMTPEQLAEQFHITYERMAPSFGYQTRKATAVPWTELPANNRNLMVAVCGVILDAIEYEASNDIAVTRAAVLEEAALLREKEALGHCPFCSLHEEFGYEPTELPFACDPQPRLYVVSAAMGEGEVWEHSVTDINGCGTLELCMAKDDYKNAWLIRALATPADCDALAEHDKRVALEARIEQATISLDVLTKWLKSEILALPASDIHLKRIVAEAVKIKFDRAFELYEMTGNILPVIVEFRAIASSEVERLRREEGEQ